MSVCKTRVEKIHGRDVRPGIRPLRRLDPARGLEFPVSGWRFTRPFIRALVC
jgi:hypothetical protein